MERNSTTTPICRVHFDLARWAFGYKRSTYAEGSQVFLGPLTINGDPK